MGQSISPYVNGGAAGRLYILVILATKFKLTELFPQLEKFLSKFSGRYVKNATISSGAAGLGMKVSITVMPVSDIFKGY